MDGAACRGGVLSEKTITTPVRVGLRNVITRRRFIQFGVGGAVALAVARLANGPFASDPEFKVGLPYQFKVLDEAGRTAIAAIAAVMLEGALPTDIAKHEEALQEAVIGVDVAISGLPLAVQKEVADLLLLLKTPVTRRLLVGVSQPWREAPAESVRHFLTRWRYSSLALMRSGYQALHQIIFAAWYGNPHSWGGIGYDGPPLYVREALYNE